MLCSTLICLTFLGLMSGMFKLCAGYAFKVENIFKVNFKHTNLCMELGAACQGPKMIKPLSKFLGIRQQQSKATSKSQKGNIFQQ